MLDAGGQLHQCAARVDKRNMRADASKRDRRAFMNFDAQAIWHKTHYARRFHPWNLLKLLLPLSQRNKKNVAAYIAAHHFHDLRVSDVIGASNFDLIAGIDTETPGMFSVAVQVYGGSSQNRKRDDRRGYPHQPVGSFFG